MNDPTKDPASNAAAHDAQVRTMAKRSGLPPDQRLKVRRGYTNDKHTDLTIFQSSDAGNHWANCGSITVDTEWVEMTPLGKLGEGDTMMIRITEADR